MHAYTLEIEWKYISKKCFDLLAMAVCWKLFTSRCPQKMFSVIFQVKYKFFYVTDHKNISLHINSI